MGPVSAVSAVCIAFLFTGTNTVKISNLNFGCKVMYSGSVTYCRRVKFKKHLWIHIQMHI